MFSLDQVPTGIKELDTVLGGGFERGSMVLVAGHPGAGKTTLAAQLLYEGLRRGEPTLYLSFAERKEEFLKHMRGVGMDFKPHIEKGAFYFVPAITATNEESLKALAKLVIEVAADRGVRRLTVDPITVPLQVLPPSKARAFLHSSLMSSLKSMGVTSVMVADLPYGTWTIGYGFEEFLADVVFVLRVEEARGLARRVLEVRKLRGRPTPRLSFEFVITRNGIVLYVPYLTGLKGGYKTERVPTGVQRLDDMLGGGLLAGSTVLVSGPSGTGKTMLAAVFALEGVRRGETVVYISFEEPENQLRSLFNTLGYNSKEMKGRLLLFSLSPRLFTPGSLYYFFREVLEKEKPQRVVVDGLSSLNRQFGDEFMELARNMGLLAKSLGATTLFTSLENALEGEEAGVSTLADVIIALWYERGVGEFKRMISVMKERGSNHERSWYEIRFAEGKVVIE